MRLQVYVFSLSFTLILVMLNSHKLSLSTSENLSFLSHLEFSSSCVCELFVPQMYSECENVFVHSTHAVIQLEFEFETRTELNCQTLRKPFFERSSENRASCDFQFETSTERLSLSLSLFTFSLPLVLFCAYVCVSLSIA